MSPWEKLLEKPHAPGHFVQLYEADEAALTRNVGHYLWEGLRRGEGVLVIATPEHTEIFGARLSQLGADPQALRASRQLIVLDAQSTLARIMVAGQPDWQQFESVVRAAMREVHPAHGAEGLRAYGEMVGILWKARQFAAAVRLEQLWNKVLEQSSFSLFCAYAIDIFGKEFEVSNLDGVLSTHTHLVPAQLDGTLETALNRALDEILGTEADALRVVMKSSRLSSYAVMPTAEAMVLWLRKNLPDQADRIIARARHYYELRLQPAG